MPNRVVIEKVEHINLGLAFIPVSGTILEKLEKCKETLLQVFGECCAGRNEKWARYLVRGVPSQIGILENLEEVTI